MCFHSEMNFFCLLGVKCIVISYVGTLKQISADFQSYWMDGKITKYIARGKGIFFYSLLEK